MIMPGLLKGTGDGSNVGQKIERGVRDVAIGIVIGAVVVSVLLANSSGSNGSKAGVGVGVMAFLLFAAAVFVGVGLGFLFGMPRARFADLVAAENAGSDESASNRTGTAASLSRPTSYLANSNLTKVSDWLTTIVVGLALVNLGNAISALRDLAVALREPLGGAAYAGAVGLSLLIIGAVAGFTGMYLWTSIRVRELLEQSEQQFVIVPDLVGSKLGDARIIVGRTPLNVDAPKEAPADSEIVDQSRSPGTLAPRGAAVKVTVSG
jgi:hypothetical protein